MLHPTAVLNCVGTATEQYKLADLNAEAQESGDDEDEVEWEDG